MLESSELEEEHHNFVVPDLAEGEQVFSPVSKRRDSRCTTISRSYSPSCQASTSGIRRNVCGGAFGETLWRVCMISEFRSASLKWTMEHSIGPGVSVGLVGICLSSLIASSCKSSRRCGSWSNMDEVSELSIYSSSRQSYPEVTRFLSQFYRPRRTRTRQGHRRS